MACKYYINGLTLSKDEFLNYVKKQPLSESSKILGIASTPDAPFITNTNNYVKLGLKYALKQAVDEGANTIAWTTGEQQNDRYDLSKQVDKIDVEAVEDVDNLHFVDIKLSNGTTENLEVENGIIREGNYKGQRLDNVVGKDYADKILSTPKGESATLQGEDLKVGGKGMIGFYGSPSQGKEGIIGGVAKALVKELTGVEGKIGETNINKIIKNDLKISYNPLPGDGRVWFVHDNEGRTISRLLTKELAEQEVLSMLKERQDAVKNPTQNSIEITPELKQAVKSGLPLFKDPSKSFADKVRQAKVNGGKAFDAILGIPVFFWNQSVETVALAIEGGASVSEAIKKGIEYIKKQKVKFDEKAYIDKMNEILYGVENEATGGDKKTAKDFEEAEEIFDEEQQNVLGITKKELKRIQELEGSEEFQVESKDIEVDRATAKRLVAEGYNIKDLVKKIKNGYRPSRVEVFIIKDYFVSITASNNKNPTPELLKERDSLIQIIREAGADLGRAVQALDGVIALEDNLSSFLMEESKWVDLTQDEINDLTDKYNKAKEALDKLNDLTEKARQEAVEKEIQKRLDQQKKENRTKGTVKEDFKQERKQYVSDFREALRKIRKTPQAVIVPYAQELIVAAPFVRKMVQSYVKEGIYDLKTIVKGIHDELKTEITDLTEQDVRDVIAGQYVNTRNTKNAKLSQIRDLERQAKLERKIEQLEAGILESNNRTQNKTNNKEIKALEKQVAEIKKRNPDLTYPSKIQSRKTWYGNRIDDLKKDIKEGNFDKVEPPIPILLDAEALKLKDEYIKFKAEMDDRRRKKEYEALSKFQKGLKQARGLLDLKRAVQVSVDLSIPVRQGIAVMLNPRTSAIGVDAYGKMLQSVKSKINYDRMMFDIEQSPAYLESKDDGVVYNEVSNTTNNNDEWHNNNPVLDKIPVIRDLVNISELAAAAWSNYVRFELYKRQVEKLLAVGKTRENSKEAYESMALRVMVDTGRGKLPFISDKSPSKEGAIIKQTASSVMFGPRLYMSIFRKLNPMFYFGIPHPITGKVVDKTVRIEALKDMAGYVAGQLLLGIAVTLAGGVVSLDPDDPDFLKARFGKRVVDLTAGQSAYIRTFLRIVKGAYMRADPDVSREDGEKYADFAKQSIGTFWRNKLAPNTSYLFSMYSGKNSIGEKFDPYEIIKIYPMYGDDIIESFKKGSPLDAALVLGIGISGLGYQEYSKNIRRAKLSIYVTDPTVKTFLKKNQLNVQGDLNQELTDNQGAEILMTAKESDKYEEVWADYVAERIKSQMTELQVLADKDKKHEGEDGYKKKLNIAIGRIKSDATDKAKEDVMGVVPSEISTIEINNRKYALSENQIKQRKALINQWISKNSSSKMKGIREGLINSNIRVTPYEIKKALRGMARAKATMKLKDKYPNGQGMKEID